jgi:tripartite-type tricarboxylate transporter receptor subunit TctC
MKPLSVLLSVFASLATSVAAQAAAYPDKPIKVIVPYTPGSGPDVVARTLGTAIAPRIQQPFVVENKPGANGTSGIDAIAKSPADGYTIGVVVNSFSINPSLYKNVADPTKAFEPLGLVARGSMVLVTRPALGVKDIASLVAAARARPDGLTYATPGNGSPQHLATALLGQSASIPLVHVPYRGSGPAVTAALSGEVDLMFMPVHTAVPFIKDGKLKALMVSTAKRSSRLLDVPTAQELGVRNFDVDLWYAVVAPSGLPADVLKRMRTEVEAAVREPAVVAGFDGQGLESAYLAPAAFNKLLQADMARWAEVIRNARITVD